MVGHSFMVEVTVNKFVVTVVDLVFFQINVITIGQNKFAFDIMGGCHSRVVNKINFSFILNYDRSVLDLTPIAYLHYCDCLVG